MLGTTDDLFRFMRKIAFSSGCWTWTGRTHKGYGVFFSRGKEIGAHRWIYRQIKADLIPGLHIEHTCNRRNCVNPLHLDQVTPYQNVQRLVGKRWGLQEA